MSHSPQQDDINRANLPSAMLSLMQNNCRTFQILSTPTFSLWYWMKVKQNINVYGISFWKAFAEEELLKFYFQYTVYLLYTWMLLSYIYIKTMCVGRWYVF